jgi:hypothetical protein
LYVSPDITLGCQMEEEGMWVGHVAHMVDEICVQGFCGGGGGVAEG